MTLLIATIAAPTPDRAIADIAAAVSAGADVVELRADFLADCDNAVLAGVAASRPDGLPLILTIRSSDEGGHWDGDDDERISRMIALGNDFDLLDVEFALWQRSANIRLKIDLARHARQGHGGRLLILSSHHLHGRPPNLMRIMARMYDTEEADIIKVAWTPRTIRDNFEAFDLLRAASRPTVIICLGPAGKISRILSKKFNAHACYASVDPDNPAAPGQLSIEQLKHDYRWDAIGPATRVFGVIGDPVGHSLSPPVHNAAFAELDMDAVYVPLQVAAGYESFKAFLVEARARPWLDLVGLSITAPHKQNALRFAREAGVFIDPLVDRVGAINTLKLNTDGSFAIANTDAPAALAAIEKLLSASRIALAGCRAAVLGAGGVAHAVVDVLVHAGAAVTIFNRTPEPARDLAAATGCQAAPWDDRTAFRPDLLVNCTTVGLAPNRDASPMPADALAPATAVLDTIYNPLRTRLLCDAERRGCPNMNGLSFFLEQAQRQFEFWTGRPAPADCMRIAAERWLSHES